MADLKISELTAVTSPVDTAEVAVNEGGSSKRMTVAQVLGLASGGGDVTASGTPVDGEIPVWTSATDIKGSSNDFVYNGAVFKVVCSQEMRLTGDLKLQTGSGQAPLLRDTSADVTVPTICPAVADTNTGLGWLGGDRLSIISGGVAGLILAELNGAVIPAYDTESAITAFAGGGQGSAVQLDHGYNVATTVATTGDSVKLPTGLVFLKGAVVYIKNNGANSLDLFPGSGDDLGQGTDVALAVPAGASVGFLATTAGSTWTQIIFAVGGGGAEVNDLTSSVTWANIPDGNVPESAVTQHESALTILESQITNANILARVGSAETITSSWIFDSGLLMDDGASLDFSSGAANETAILAMCDEIFDLQFGSATDRFDIGIGAPDKVTRLGTGFFLVERAAAASDISGYGQFWARTDNTPMFTTEAGVDIELDASGGGGDLVDDTTPQLGGFLDLNSNSIRASTATGPEILDEAATATNPVLIPRRNQLGTGVGAFSTNAVSLIAISTEGFRVAESEGTITNTTFGDLVSSIATGPALLNEAATTTNPTLLPNQSDNDSGIGGTAGTVNMIANSVEGIRVTEGEGSIATGFAGRFEGLNVTGSAAIRDIAASATVPTIHPTKTNLTMGLGAAGSSEMNFIVDGLSCMSVAETEGARQLGFYVTSPISLQTGVAVTAGGIHAALVALGLITA